MAIKALTGRLSKDLVIINKENEDTKQNEIEPNPDYNEVQDLIVEQVAIAKLERQLLEHDPEFIEKERQRKAEERAASIVSLTEKRVSKWSEATEKDINTKKHQVGQYQSGNEEH